jgi:acetoin utilization deacetylase AcuC-like enzyme
MILIHDPRCAEYATPGHPERPARVIDSAAHLHRAHPGWQWSLPSLASDDAILRVHSATHLARLSSGADFDADTAFHPDIGNHARRSAGAAIDAAQLALRGQRAFSLMRPPGHHATREQAMGFCYLNSIAIAAADAIARGVGRVSIWDFDGHHGNGTEAISEGHAPIRYVSAHEHPAYPGTGSVSRGNIFNFPISPHSPHSQQLAILQNSWSCVLDFQPQLILISAGFDAYIRDPLLSLALDRDDFAALGKWLAQSGIPTAAILEGGYSADLPLLIDAFLSAWENGSVTPPAPTRSNG